MKFIVNQERTKIRTNGLLDIWGRELEVEYKYAFLKDEVKKVLLLMIDQLAQSTADVSWDLSMRTGYWDIYFKTQVATYECGMKCSPERQRPSPQTGERDAGYNHNGLLCVR